MEGAVVYFFAYFSRLALKVGPVYNESRKKQAERGRKEWI